MDRDEIRKMLVGKQGDLEEDLKIMGGKKPEDMSKEMVFEWMKWKAQWETITEILERI